MAATRHRESATPPATREPKQPSKRPTPARLGADAWVAAGLQAIGRGGIAAVAVEPLAVELGVTKGSFYWHFSTRDKLLEAVILRWEEIATTAVIAAAERGGSAREQLELLLAIVMRPLPDHSVETAIIRAAPNPVVSPVVQRVAERRMAYLVGVFRGLGFERAQATRRGYTAYAAYIGMLQLEAQASPRESLRTSRRYVDELITMFLSGAPEPDRPGDRVRRRGSG